MKMKIPKINFKVNFMEMEYWGKNIKNLTNMLKLELSLQKRKRKKKVKYLAQIHKMKTYQKKIIIKLLHFPKKINLIQWIMFNLHKA